MVKVAVILTVLAMANGALASYDLLLVADTGDATQSTRVHRYDATTGRYLGFFAERSPVRIRSVAAMRDSGRAFVLDETGGIRSFDYSTGISIRTVVPSSLFTNLVTFNNRLFAYSSSVYAEVNPDTGSVSSSSVLGGRLRAMVISRSGIMYRAVAANTSTQWFRGAVSTSESVPVGPAMGADFFGTQIAQAAVIDDPVEARFLVGPSLESDFTVFNSVTNSSTTWGFDAFISNNLGYSYGHDTLYVTGSLKTDPAQKRIAAIESRLIGPGALFGGPELRNPVALASVVAPEPGTLLALGAGLAFLARRRRKRE